MLNLTLKEIIEITDGTLIKGDPKTIIKSISTDSRKTKKNDFFIALSGRLFEAIPSAQHDGHDFLTSVFKKKLLGVLVSRNIQIPFLNIIKVKDTFNAYQAIAKYWREKFKIPIIAITGSCGKTSVTQMLTSVLSQKYRVLSSQNGFNNQIGLPQTLLKLNKSHQIVILEMGTNMPGEIDILANIAKPTVSVITNIGPAHLEKLKNLKGVAKEKANILKPAKIVLLNKKGLFFKYLKRFAQGKIINFSGKTASEQNKNIVLKIAKLFNLTDKQIMSGLQKYRTPKMRMEKIKLKGLTIINDAYNANPLSMRTALEIFNQKKKEGRKKIRQIAILADMLELGNKSNFYHRQIGKILPSSIDILITIGHLSKIISEEAKKRKRIKEIYHFNNNLLATKFLKKNIKPGDFILLKGSRKMKLEEIVENLS